MKTIFLSGIRKFGIGQAPDRFSWNNINNGLTPEQNLLQQNMQAGSGAPQNPGFNALQNPAFNAPQNPGAMAAGGNCFTCSNGGPSQDVDAATAASLRKQGYVCYPCQQHGGGDISSFSGFGGMTGQAMPAESMIAPNFGSEGFANLPGGFSGGFMGARQVKLVRRPGF